MRISKHRKPVDRIPAMELLQKEYSYFIKCAEILNISKASEIVGIQQAGLSKIIQKLEKEIGFSLFIRKTTGLELTHEGTKLYEILKNTKVFLDQHIAESFTIDEEPTGSLMIGCHGSIAIEILPRILPGLCARFPKLQFDTFFERSVEVTRQVTQLQVDLGFVINKVRSPEIVSRTIETEYLAGYSQNDQHDDTLVYNPETLLSSKHVAFFKRFEKVPVRDYEAIASLVRKSSFLGLLPNTVAERYNLKMVTEPLMSTELNFIYHKEKMKSPARRKIVDECNRLLLGE